MAAKGEVRVDQAHRGYSVVEDDIGKLDVSSLNQYLYTSIRAQKLIISTTPSTLSTLPTKMGT
jgi:hypothetical protein